MVVVSPLGTFMVPSLSNERPCHFAVIAMVAPLLSNASFSRLKLE